MLLAKDDFQKGQVVALKYAGNLARRNDGYRLGTVKSAGKKYVSASLGDLSDKGIQFILDEKYHRDYLLQKSNYTGDYELFPSEQAYLEYEEKKKKLSEIKDKVDPMYSQSILTIDQVRRIYDIVNE